MGVITRFFPSILAENFVSDFARRTQPKLFSPDAACFPGFISSSKLMTISFVFQ